MSSPSRVRVSGPLVGHAAGFRADLEAQGYRRNVVANQLQLFAHLSRWLESKGLGPQHLTRERVLEFLSARRSAGYTLWLSEKGVAPLLTYLRSVGVAPAPEAPVAVASADRVLEEFRSYLVHERGLAPGTVAADVQVARLFLATRVHPDLGLEALTPADVVAFVTAQCGQRSAAYVTTGLRAFLRFCHLSGPRRAIAAGARHRIHVPRAGGQPLARPQRVPPGRRRPPHPAVRRAGHGSGSARRAEPDLETGRRARWQVARKRAEHLRARAQSPRGGHDFDGRVDGSGDDRGRPAGRPHPPRRVPAPAKPAPTGHADQCRRRRGPRAAPIGTRGQIPGPRAAGRNTVPQPNSGRRPAFR